MRHVKKEYEICAQTYQSVIAKIGQRASTMEAQQRDNNGQQQHKQRPSPMSNANSTTQAADEDEDRVKSVCW
jgi:hypothetical protein